MSEPGAGVSPPLAVLFPSVGFFALLIAGLGVVSLLTGADVLAVPGLGQVPGVVGTAASVIVFAATTWRVVRRRPARYGSVAVVVIATFLAYLFGVLVGAVFAGVDFAAALSAAGGFATSWFALVLASAAFVAAWSAVALVRTKAHRPQWPWEHDEP